MLSTKHISKSCARLFLETLSNAIDLMDCEHLEKLFRAELARVEEKFETRLQAMDQALRIARDEHIVNLEHLNQVRQTFVSKELFQTTLDKIRENNRTMWLAIIGWILAIGMGTVALIKVN